MKKALLRRRYSAMTLLCNTTLLCVGYHPLLAVKVKIHPFDSKEHRCHMLALESLGCWNCPLEIH